MGFENLTRRHGVKVVSNASVEVCSLAVGEVVGHGEVKSASRMNKSIVLFLSSVEKANQTVQHGIVLDGTLVPVLPLSLPSKKVIISNVPPFIPSELIERELIKFGHLVSPIRMIPLGCKSPLLKHVVSFRRQTFMILKGEELNLTLKLKVDGFHYTVFVTSDTYMKCFGCGKIGHLISECPGREGASGLGGGASVAEAPAAAETRSAGELSAERTTVLNVPEQVGAVVDKSAAAEPVDGKNVKLTMTDTAQLNAAGGPSCSSLGSTVAHIEEPSAERKSAPDDAMDCVFKAPKRKQKTCSNADAKKHVKQVISTFTDSDSDYADGYTTDSSGISYSYRESMLVIHSADDIKVFLAKTKGKRGIEIKDYFNDTGQFLNDVCHHIKNDAFDQKEVYRLNVFVCKLKKEFAVISVSGCLGYV